MRLLFGIILGVFLTVGVAFISDNWTSDQAATGATESIAHRNMVNWDVVEDNVRVARHRVHDAWTALSRKVSS